MRGKVEYVVALYQEEVDAITIAMSTFLQMPMRNVKFTETEREYYELMKEEMKYLQMRFSDLKKLKDQDLGEPNQ